MSRLIISLFFILSFSVLADEAPLDPSYGAPLGVMRAGEFGRLGFFRETALPTISDLKTLIGLQTPVKSQARRGVCSMFSATGLVESLVKIHWEDEVDFAENYLVYNVVNNVQYTPKPGSNTYDDIEGFQKFGAISESTWPYETEDWYEGDLDSVEKEKAEKTCGEFKGSRRTGCLLGHMDPKNDLFQEEAKEVKAAREMGKLRVDVLYQEEEIKKHLNANYPLVVGVDFFYKAWNHRKMVEYGLGERDMSAWDKGIVSVPTEEDIKKSHEHRAGHSVVLVGYDDNERVFYFKNSWGTSGFGANSDFLGEGTTAGYGKIAYDYIFDYGTVYLVYFSNRKPGF